MKTMQLKISVFLIAGLLFSSWANAEIVYLHAATENKTCPPVDNPQQNKSTTASEDILITIEAEANASHASLQFEGPENHEYTIVLLDKQGNIFKQFSNIYNNTIKIVSNDFEQSSYKAKVIDESTRETFISQAKVK